MPNNEPWMGPLPAAPGCDCHVCRPDESYDEQDRRVIDTVLKHGWQVIMVAEGAGCDDPDHHSHSATDHDEVPAFAYTIGPGHRVGHPELLMSGLEPHLMHQCLNGVARRIMDGLRLEPGDALEDVVAGVPVAVELVSDLALAETVTWSGGSIAASRKHSRSSGPTDAACSRGNQALLRSSRTSSQPHGGCAMGQVPGSGVALRSPS